jgi:MFS family permease
MDLKAKESASDVPAGLEMESVYHLPEHVEEQIDEVAERRLLRKLDRWIIPPVVLLYLFSFIDRVNIGNARLYGLESDLGLVDNQYQIAVSILFATYVAAEVPSNLVLKKIGPSRWIAFITAGFGLVAILTGIVQNFGSLIACRLVLGALEGGLFPGLTVYLTMFYTKKELALRIGYMFIASAVAGSVGGLLAYVIGFMDGVAGLRGWRWIFIIEGIPTGQYNGWVTSPLSKSNSAGTVLLGLLVLVWLANDPETARYLSPEEQVLAVQRLQRQTGHTAKSSQMHKQDVYAAFRDWKIWTFAVGQFGVNTILYGYSTFLPTIIRGLGRWSTAQVQALTVPCYALGAITYLMVAWCSDRYQRRTIWVVSLGAVSAAGYAILISPAPGGVKYLGCCIVGIGLYVIVGIPLAWLPINNPRYGKRTVATGLQTTIGNSAGIAAPFVRLLPRETSKTPLT